MLCGRSNVFLPKHVFFKWFIGVDLVSDLWPLLAGRKDGSLQLMEQDRQGQSRRTGRRLSCGRVFADMAFEWFSKGFLMVLVSFMVGLINFMVHLVVRRVFEWSLQRFGTMFELDVYDRFIVQTSASTFRKWELLPKRVCLICMILTFETNKLVGCSFIVVTLLVPPAEGWLKDTHGDALYQKSVKQAHGQSQESERIHVSEFHFTIRRQEKTA